MAMREQLRDLRKKEIRLTERYNLETKVVDPLTVVLATPRNHFFSALSIGHLVLYDHINRNPDIPAIADRAFFYDFLKDSSGKEGHLLGLEGEKEIRKADILGFSLSNPLEFPQFFKLMDLIRLPYRSVDREYPIVVGGGHGFTNPEPMADFFDVFILGEGAQPLEKLINLLYESKKRGDNKQSFLHNAKSITGVYIPAHFDFQFKNAGRIARIIPKSDYDTVRIQRGNTEGLRGSSVVMVDGFASLLVATGCKEKCHYCQLGRDRFSVIAEEEAKQTIDDFVRAGARVIGLQAGTPTQVPHLTDLIKYINSKGNIKLIVGSLLLNEITDELLKCLKDSQAISSRAYYLEGAERSSINIAPETVASRTLRRLNRPFEEEAIEPILRKIAKYNFDEVIMNLMDVGDKASLDAMSDMLSFAYNLFDKHTYIVAQVNPLIPSPNTVAQRMEMLDVDEFTKDMNYVRSRIAQNIGTAEFGDRLTLQPLPEGCILYEAVTMRNDRRIGEVLENMHRKGIGLEDLDKRTLFTVMSEEEYEQCRSGKDLTDVLPWDHIKYGVSLEKERNLLHEEY